MDANNTALQKNAFIYIYVSTAAVVLLIIGDVCYYVYYYDLTPTPAPPLERPDDIENPMATIVDELSLLSPPQKHERKPFSSCLRRSTMLAELKTTLQFITVVMFFEYFFFVYVVQKYQIANPKSMLCQLLVGNSEF